MCYNVLTTIIVDLIPVDSGHTISGTRGNIKVAPTLSQSTFVARVLTQQFEIAYYYFVISAHFLISAYFLTT